MRLIDADTLIKEFERYMLDPKELRDAIYTINYTPTVEAVPVIRCKDCRYHLDGMNTCLKYAPQVVMMDDNDFCSWAERREDD